MFWSFWLSAISSFLRYLCSALSQCSGTWWYLASGCRWELHFSRFTVCSFPYCTLQIPSLHTFHAAKCALSPQPFLKDHCIIHRSRTFTKFELCINVGRGCMRWLWLKITIFSARPSTIHHQSFRFPCSPQYGGTCVLPIKLSFLFYLISVATTIMTMFPMLTSIWSHICTCTCVHWIISHFPFCWLFADFHILFQCIWLALLNWIDVILSDTSCPQTQKKHFFLFKNFVVGVETQGALIIWTSSWN